MQSGEVKESYFAKDSSVNSIAYALALESIVSQWKASEILYNWVIQDKSIFVTCTSTLQPTSLSKMLIRLPLPLHKTIKASSLWINTSCMRPSANTSKRSIKYILTRAPMPLLLKVGLSFQTPSITTTAAMPSRWLISATRNRYDLIFGEPHGALMATKVFIDAMGKKRKPIRPSYHEQRCWYDLRLEDA